MNDFFARRGSVIHQPQGSHIVRLRIAFSGQYPDAPAEFDKRLTALLRDACVMVTDRHVTLVRGRRAITPTDWSALIGWLLCQPEVVFVAREYPVNGSQHGPR